MTCTCDTVPVEELARRVRAALAEAGYPNASVRIDDGGTRHNQLWTRVYSSDGDPDAQTVWRAYMVTAPSCTPCWPCWGGQSTESCQRTGACAWKE